MAGVKGKSGRKKMSVHRHNTINIITETSPLASAYLKRVVKGEEKANPARIDACKYIINQDLGLPKARAEVFSTKDLSVWTELIGDNGQTEGGTDTEKPE